MTVNSFTIIGNTTRIAAIGTHVDEKAQALGGGIPCRDDTTPYGPMHGNSMTGATTATVGTSAYPYAGLHLTSDAKIYTGSTEFTGGSGDTLATVEGNLNLLKSGWDWPVTVNNDMWAGDANIVTNNLECDLFRDYSTSDTTTIHLLPDRNVLSDCETTSDGGTWVQYGAQAGAIAADAVLFYEGSNSLKTVVSATTTENGIYIDFATEISLANRKLPFVFAVDTLSNISTFTVTLASETGESNTVDYDYTTQYDGTAFVASGTGWNRIIVDLGATPDRTAGTFLEGTVKRIKFAITPDSSQAFQLNVDYLADISNRAIPENTVLNIYDNTNLELMNIDSVASNYKCTMASALSNNYDLDTTAIKMRGVDIDLNVKQTKWLSGLSGAAASDIYDIVHKDLPELAESKKLNWLLSFNTDRFEISTVTSTTVFKVSSTVDKSAYFKDTNAIWVFQYSFNGIDFDNNYSANANMLANAKRLIMSADGTFASDEITITNSGSNQGIAADGTWFCIPENNQFYYDLFNTSTETPSLMQATPTTLIAHEDSLPYPSYAHSHWTMNNTGGEPNQIQSTGYDLAEGGTAPTTSGIINKARGPFTSSNYLGWESSASSSTVYDTNNFMIELWFKCASVTSSNETFVGKSNSAFTGGWSIRATSATKKINFRGGGVDFDIASNNAIDDNAWHHILCSCRASSGSNEVRMFIDGVQQTATATGAVWGKTTVDFIVGATDQIGAANSPALDTVIDDVVYYSSVPTTWDEIEEIVTARYNNGLAKKYANNNGFTIKGTEEDKSGNKIIIANKFTREDTTNQDPRGNMIAATITA